MLNGTCHCGAVHVLLTSSRPPTELPVRMCGCSFCLRHRPLYTSDPAGHLEIKVAREAELIRYRFGLQLADFLLCASCGVFVAALEPGPPARAVLNLAILDLAAEFTSTPTRFEAYDSEDVAARTARRARGWTPAKLILLDPA
ncbi:MAG: hypothetical protein R3B48_22810 [Kofleriaceae bacterium]